MINIIGITETVGHFGERARDNAQEAFRLLGSAQEEITDDILFWDEFNQSYQFDDLVGQRVQVGTISFVVQES